MNNDIIKKSINTGLSGSTAMIAQVSSLMWLRTTMNYQYRHGTTFLNTIKTLYNQGGIPRFYKGYPIALMVGPLSRFGDTASNALVLNYLKDSDLNMTSKTVLGSAAASLWRVGLMPLDVLKTTLQVEGKGAIGLLKNKIRTNGVGVMYYGTMASMSATFVGHYPWFLTYNILNDKLPNYDKNSYKQFIRNGFIGFNAAIISDTCSNSLRVIKTSRQTYAENISYRDTIKNIVKQDGYQGLFGRGLKTRILTNGLNGIIFTICWKYIEQTYNK